MKFDPRKGKHAAIICFLLAAATLAAYWPARLNDFVQYDDQDYVTANSHVQQGLTWDGTLWAFQTSHSANWHPVTWLSHMLDCQLFGLRPAGHHLTNVLLHILNTVLLFLVLRQITFAPARSAFVAALFALHPLHVESVAWVSERKDLLSSLFGLLSLMAYARYAKGSNSLGQIRATGLPRSPARKLPPPAYWLALACFCLSLMSKPMLVTLPFLMLLLDYWPLTRLPIDRPRWHQLKGLLAEKLPFLALSIASCATTILVQQQAMLYHRELSFGDRTANALVSYVRYLGKTVWPRELVAPYPHPARWPEWQVVASAIVLLVLTGCALWNRRRRPYLVVSWLWFVGLLIPVIGLVQVGVAAMADRYTYLPLIGIFVTLAWGGGEWIGTDRFRALVAGSVAAALLMACALRTGSQVRVWRNTETLFTHATALTTNNWVAHYNLALLAMQRYQAGPRVANQSSTANPQNEAANGASQSRDYLQQVVQHCQAAIQGRPAFSDIYVTLAKALTEQNKLDSARQQIEAAIRLNPRSPEARQNFAEILYRQGYAREAVMEYEAALMLRPNWEAVLNNAAWLLATHPGDDVRNGAEAVRLARRACELTGHTNLWFLHTLAAAEAENGAFSNAVEAATTALRLALATGQKTLSDAAAARRDLYASGRPYRHPPPSR